MFFATIVAVCVLDQLVKALVVKTMLPGDSFRLIFGIEISHVRNTGAAFGLFAGRGQVLFWVALGIVVIMLFWFFRSQGNAGAWYYLGVGLIVGGSAGNLIDRVFRGTVVDYVDLGWWPVFNLADIAIVAGVLTITALLLFDMRATGEGSQCGKKG